MIQLITGIILAIRFSSHATLSFDSVILIYQDANYGWFLRLLHSTGASFFFVFLYLHIGRGLYYGSYVYQELWNIGVIIYLLLMGTAFLGYVLP
jgi:ubiquinol-cytochrome c reductase cytochrome b subunit